MHTPQIVQTRRWRALASALLATTLAIAVFAIWWRNRDILRDLYDYSTVVSAAGKVGAGLRPYTDVRSPMQSSVYYLNWAVEAVFGRSYLGLSWGGLVQALGGGLLLSALLWRRFGPPGALLLAGAVALAGLIQHTVFFYNPIGILCFAVVVTGVALQPSLWPLRSPTVVTVLAALVLGGTNKLNFQGLALLLAGLLVLRAWAARQLTPAAVIRSAVVLALAGLVMPVVVELLWTGASLSLWLQEVVLQPTARHAAIAQAWDPQILLRPPHDLHHHVLVRPIGGIGLGLLMATGAWALWPRRDENIGWADRVLRLLVVLSGAVSGALLMVTNVETALLTSLAFPLVAVALYLACRRADPPATERWAGRGLMTGLAVWCVAGGYAAWHGSRVLYAPDPPLRVEYERLVHAPRSLAYFEGVRIHRPLLDSLRALATRVEQLERGAGGMRGMLFGPAVEWFERAYPEAIVPGMPIWYDQGTSLSDLDVPWFEGTLRRAGVRRILSDTAWENWPPSLSAAMARNYRIERVGSRFRLYHPRFPRGVVPPEPVVTSFSQDEFRLAAESNVLLTATVPVGGMEVQKGPRGGFFGRRGRSIWAWPLGAEVMQGRATAVIEQPGPAAEPLTFRIIAGPQGDSEVLWEMPVHLGPRQRLVDIPFFIRPMGRQLLFEVQAPGALADRVTAGWRELRITQASSRRPVPALPISAGLRRQPGPSNKKDELWFAAPGKQPKDGWHPAPFENWRWRRQDFTPVRMQVEFAPGPADWSPEVSVTLGWYRAGRFEVMTHRTVNVNQNARLVFEGGVPEADGWIGIVVSPLHPHRPGPRAKVVYLPAAATGVLTEQ